MMPRRGHADEQQAIVFATAAWLIVLGVLGMAPMPELPINDKALHFFGASPEPAYSSQHTDSV